LHLRGAVSCTKSREAARFEREREHEVEVEREREREVEPEREKEGMTAYYDAEATRDEYLRFHFPESDELAALLAPLPAPPLGERFPVGVRRFWDPAPGALALDLGCACGRMTLELARDHAVAVGMDRSALLVAAARAVASTGRARYPAVVEGHVRRAVDVPVEVPGRVAFHVGDAHAPPYADGRFATVVALNLVDRVGDPARCLAAAGRLVRPGGLLIVSSPYTWKAEYADPARWLGGVVRDDGRPVHGAEGVREALGPSYRLEREGRLPFYIPWHDRSGQLAVAHVQRFRKG